MQPVPRTIPGLADRLPELRDSLLVDSSPRSVMRVAEACWLAGDSDGAIQLLKPLVDDFPGTIAPRLLLGWCLEERGRKVEARAIFDEAHALDPANPFLRRSEPSRSWNEETVELARPPGLTRSPDPEPVVAPASLTLDEETVELSPPPFEAPPRFEIVSPPAPVAAPPEPKVERDPEREAEPESALTPDELRSIPPSPLYSATLGEIFEKQGFDEKAIEIYREVVRQNPDREDLLARIEALESRVAGEPDQ